MGKLPLTNGRNIFEKKDLLKEDRKKIFKSINMNLQMLFGLILIHRELKLSIKMENWEKETKLSKIEF